ncbi:MAG: 2-oxoacid:acceptor oxidoreductase subunit alpha [Chlorobiaceae bacterium]|nr:2-oxoacid:acceptor oxidoreductase subunit alpha [Chlorobiaceae bacterium]
MHEDSHDLCLVFEGEAGQGIQTVSSALLPILKNSGYQVFSCTEYMSRIRGGSNTTELRITGKKRTAYSSSIDMLFAMSPLALERLKGRIDDGTLIFADREQFGERWGTNCIDMPLKRLATEAGGALYANTVIAGAVLCMIGIPVERFNGYLQEQFSAKGESVVSANFHAAGLGYEFTRKLPSGFAIQLPVPMQQGGEERLLMDGNAALGIGSVLAGCNFISSYPMSPGTGLLTFLAAHAHDYGIVVDQAEDEIAAINAGLGASYAGARAVVTTSGGGFDLMQEGVSLAGMIETPIVVHIGQRPGPATGLPTRTEQGELALVLHAGHGEFPRAVFAPGTTAEIIEIAQIAFDVAETYQIPVFLLTDQYLLDAVCTIESGEIRRLPIASTIIETTDAYRRYEFTDDGLSPRGIPGFGSGIVRVDSDEHDESGVITESFEMRRHMVEKRLKRMERLRADARPATPIGTVEKARTILVCWGSNRGVVEEALEFFDSPDMAGLHFSQLYPLQPKSLKLLENRRVIVIENNALGQFADLLTLETGRKIDRRVLKATGEPFSVEEVIEALEEEENG